MNFYKLTALLASIFSVIFSLSIIKELAKFVHPIVLVFVLIFLVLFVIYNELSKIRELQRFFKKQKHNKVAIVTTFIISFFLSGVGIWLWTNNTLETEITLNNDLQAQKLSIERTYQKQIDSVLNVPISSPEYVKLTEDIDFWRNRKSDSKQQRQEILLNIRKLELKRENLYNTLENKRKSEYERIQLLKSNELDLLLVVNSGEVKNMSRNNFISTVFFLMVIVTEVIILNVQRQIANFYSEEQTMLIRIVKDIEYRNLPEISINEFKYSQFNKYKELFKANEGTDEQWRETKNSHNLLKELNVIDSENQMIGDKPSEFLIKYFNQINKL